MKRLARIQPAVERLGRVPFLPMIDRVRRRDV
jgi:hypothetical protein